MDNFQIEDSYQYFQILNLWIQNTNLYLKERKNKFGVHTFFTEIHTCMKPVGNKFMPTMQVIM